MARKNSKNTIETDVENSTESESRDIQSEVENADISDIEPIEFDETIDSDDREKQVELARKSKKSSSFSSKLLFLLLGGVAGVFAAPKLAPYVPSSIGQYLQINGGDANVGSKVDEVIATVDGLATRIDAIEAGEGSADVDALKAQLEEFSAKVAEQAESPSVVTADGEIDLGPIQAELDALKAQNSELETALKTVQGDVETKLSETQVKAAEQVEIAQTATVNAEIAGDVANLKVNALTGGSIAADIEKIKAAGVQIPDGLIELQDGVDTAASLEADFDGYAIEAIRASVVASAGQSSGFFGDIKSQLSAQFAGRSTTPQEGSTPDAILSRVEDQVRKGELDQAIAEMSALPSEAADAMKPWTERAEKRLTLLSAITEIETANASN